MFLEILSEETWENLLPILLFNRGQGFCKAIGYLQAVTAQNGNNKALSWVRITQSKT